MTVETLTTFFGWMSVINILYLLFATLMLIGLKGMASDIHARLFKLDENDVRLAYFTWLGNYKIFTVIFSLVPYIALRLM